MENLWQTEQATCHISQAQKKEQTHVQGLRVYTSRLIGQEPDLVLHGGGNTSAKETDQNGNSVMYIKGSGWDLGTIEAEGLPAVHLPPLLTARHGKKLTDEEMVALLREQLLDKNAPNPSVEALLHAFIPHKYVDHTHATAVLVLANQTNSAEIVHEMYGDKIAHLPYVMPGFDLSIAAADLFDQHPDCEGIWLQNHGLFTFADSAEKSYSRMIEYVTQAEQFIANRGITLNNVQENDGQSDPKLEQNLTDLLTKPDSIFAEGIALKFITTPDIRRLSERENLAEILARGTATPDHVIRIKPFPLIITTDMNKQQREDALQAFIMRYTDYFKRNAARATEEKTMLDPMPRLIIIPKVGIYGVGKDQKAATIAADLGEQTARIINAAEDFGAFTPINEADLFDMEYWSLEQAKLKKS